MRSLILGLAFAVFATGSIAAEGDVPPPPPLPIPPVALKAPQTWEDIPAFARLQFQRMVRPLRFQPVLRISPPETEVKTHMTEVGEVLGLQSITPAHGVKLTSAPRRDVYGAVGSALYQVRDKDREYWCNAKSVGAQTTYYCYRDTQGDGVFDELYEAVTWARPTFLNLTLGKDEKLKKSVTYEPSDPPALKNQVGLRYAGVFAGLITDDGLVVGPEGAVQFELLVGETPRSMAVLDTFFVDLDETGRGHRTLPTGQEVLVEKVEVGGRAQVTILNGLETDGVYLFPEMTRERILKVIQRKFDRNE